ncbi:MAG: sensor histidine kinase [Allosphingosinicella sp.]|uniref:sensor histidine kinase n=1 Tax=Allosphingosinicella sp. TaxID=2823234 RepID=UPI0039439FD1
MLVETLHRLQPLRSLPAAVQYGAAALVVLAFFALRYILAGLDLDPDQLPLFLVFMPAVILSALLFDKGTGYFAVAASAVLGLYFILDPRHPPVGATAADAIRVAIFVASGLLAAAIVESLRRTVDQLIERTSELAAARESLEQGYTALLASDAQKDLLLGDINHRIKNHLQLVSGYLLLGQREVGDARAAELLANAANRLRVLARVYDRLQLVKETTTVSARGFVEELCNDLQLTLIGIRPIVLTVEAEEAELSSSSAVTIGMMVNELVTNAVRYAFEDDEPGNVFVYFKRCDSGFCLEVIDDGDGFRSEERVGSIGQRLLRGLVRQLDGSIEWSGPPGTRVSVTFPERRAAPAEAPSSS